jgi:hypothetical protein
MGDMILREELWETHTPDFLSHPVSDLRPAADGLISVRQRQIVETVQAPSSQASHLPRDSSSNLRLRFISPKQSNRREFAKDANLVSM